MLRKTTGKARRIGLCCSWIQPQDGHHQWLATITQHSCTTRATPQSGSRLWSATCSRTCHTPQHQAMTARCAPSTLTWPCKWQSIMPCSGTLPLSCIPQPAVPSPCVLDGQQWRTLQQWRWMQRTPRGTPCCGTAAARAQRAAGSQATQRPPQGWAASVRAHQALAHTAGLQQGRWYSAARRQRHAWRLHVRV